MAERDWGVVWITGAGKGIGRDTALVLARRGARVAVSSRTRDDLENLAREAEGFSGAILPYPLDVTDVVAVRETVARIEAEAGPIGLALLNAGTHGEVSADRFDIATFERVVGLNLGGTANCLAVLLPLMRGRRSGKLAMVASLAGYRGLPTAAAYAASKAGVIALCEALKPELEADGVELALVNPGFVDTPLTRRNRFPMPFLMKSDKAAEALVRGLEGRRFEIIFPRRMGIVMKVLGWLPYWLFFPITRGMVRRDG